MKLSELDSELARLAKSKHVPKPEYEVWELKLVKHIPPKKSPDGTLTVRTYTSRPVSAHLCFSGPSFSFLVFFTGTNKLINSKDIDFAFSEYVEFIKSIEAK